MKVLVLCGALVAVSISPVGGSSKTNASNLLSASGFSGSSHSSYFDPISIKKCAPNCPD